MLMVKFLFVTVLLLLSGCHWFDNEWRKAPGAIIQQGDTVNIRVLIANNQRIGSMTPEQINTMLRAAQKTVWANFGVKIEFSRLSESTIEEVFSLIPDKLLQLQKTSIYNFKSGTGDKIKLTKGINQTLTERGTKLDDGLAFVKPYIPDARASDLMAFSELLSNIMLERLESWRNIKATDGTRLLDSSPYNEITYWDILGYGNLQYDLVITNQLFASAEYAGVDIHTAIRGGVTVGLTTYSRNSKFGSYVVYSTFPFMDNSEITKRLRAGETYSDSEAAELAGSYLAHEIGHMLFQFGHPFGQQSCVMNPVSMLRFREWAQQINGAACPIGSRAEMKRGAVPEYFNIKWLKMSLEP